MSEMYGQYGVFIDEHAWEYHGAWSYYYFNMTNMTLKRVIKKVEEVDDVRLYTLRISDNKMYMISEGGASTRLGPPIEAEFKRYQHWLFERAVLHD